MRSQTSMKKLSWYYEQFAKSYGQKDWNTLVGLAKRKGPEGEQWLMLAKRHVKRVFEEEKNKNSQPNGGDSDKGE